MSYTWSTPIVNPIVRGQATPLPDCANMLSHEQVPIGWFSGENLRGLQWNGKQIKLPQNPDPFLFGSIRGQDVAFFPHSKKPSGRSPQPYQKPRGTLVMKTDNESTPFICGGPDTVIEAGQIRFQIGQDSQLPSLTLEHKQKVGDSIFYHRLRFFGAQSMGDVNYHGPESLKEGGSFDWKIPEFNRKAAQEGRLVGLSIRFNRSGSQDRYLNSMIMLNGEKFADGADKWSNGKEMIKTFKEPTTFSGFDQHVYDMFGKQNLTITLLREIWPSDMACMRTWDPMYTSWVRTMKQACEHGPFWFYAMQPGFELRKPGAQLTHWDKAAHPPPVPFWLVKKCLAHVNKGQLDRLEPWEWAAIVQNPEEKHDKKKAPLPHPNLEAFLHELSVTREKAFQRRAAGIMFEQDRQHPMTIRKLTQVGNRVIWRADFSVYAGVEEGTMTPMGDKLLPSPGTNLEIKFYFGVDYSQSLSLEGEVVEALDKPINIDLVAHCKVAVGPSQILRSQGRNKPVEGSATVQVKVNYQSINRIQSAFRGVAADLTPNTQSALMEKIGPHPDGRHILLKYNARFEGKIRGLPDVRKALSDYTRSEGIHADGDINELFLWFGFLLNESQTETVISVLTGGTHGNLTVGHGPPGTGKSRTIACLAIVAHFVFGSKIAICTPSNTAAESIMEKILDEHNQGAKAKCKTWNLIRFVTASGTPLSDALSGGAETRTDGLEEVHLAQRELWKTDPRFVGYSFHENKRRFAEDNVQNLNISEKLRSSCNSWLEMMQQAKKSLLFGERRKEFKNADDAISREIMQKRCDILIGTLSSMGREEAMEFPADTIIIDECAQATLPEITIPFNTFSDTAIRAATFGDDLQLPGFLASERANEAAPHTKASAFADLRINEGDKFDVRLLNVQYRSHPALYHWSNVTFYEGKVTTHPQLLNVQPIDVTVAAFMKQQLGTNKDRISGEPLWNSVKWPRLIAVDVNLPSEQYPGSMSFWNPYELEVAMFLRDALPKFVPPKDGKAVEVDDILIISPYRGQAQASTDVVKASNRKAGSILTVTKSQGGEGLIGISTVGKNDPLKLANVGFVAQKNNLNVWFSRQQRFHIVVGNFVAREKEVQHHLRYSAAAYKGLLKAICREKWEGVTLVRPEDFADWPGYSSPLEERRLAGSDHRAIKNISEWPGRELQEVMPPFHVNNRMGNFRILVFFVFPLHLISPLSGSLKCCSILHEPIKTHEPARYPMCAALDPAS